MKTEQLCRLAKKHNLDFLLDEQVDAAALAALIEDAVMLGGEAMRGKVLSVHASLTTGEWQHFERRIRALPKVAFDEDEMI